MLSCGSLTSWVSIPWHLETRHSHLYEIGLLQCQGTANSMPIPGQLLPFWFYLIKIIMFLCVCSVNFFYPTPQTFPLWLWMTITWCLLWSYLIGPKPCSFLSLTPCKIRRYDAFEEGDKSSKEEDLNHGPCEGWRIKLQQRQVGQVKEAIFEDTTRTLLRYVGKNTTHSVTKTEQGTLQTKQPLMMEYHRDFPSYVGKILIVVI